MPSATCHRPAGGAVHVAIALPPAHRSADSYYGLRPILSPPRVCSTLTRHARPNPGQPRRVVSETAVFYPGAGITSQRRHCERRTSSAEPVTGGLWDETLARHKQRGSCTPARSRVYYKGRCINTPSCSIHNCLHDILEPQCRTR